MLLRDDRADHVDVGVDVDQRIIGPEQKPVPVAEIVHPDSHLVEIAAEALQEIGGDDPPRRKSGEVDRHVLILGRHFGGVDEPWIPVMGEHEARLRELDGDLVHRERMRVLDVPARPGRIPGVDHHRNIIRRRQFEKRKMARLGEIEMVIAGVEFEPDALRRLQVLLELLQRALRVLRRNRPGIDSGAIGDVRRLPVMLRRDRPGEIRRHRAAESRVAAVAPRPHGDGHDHAVPAEILRHAVHTVDLAGFGGRRLEPFPARIMNMCIDDLHKILRSAD